MKKIRGVNPSSGDVKLLDAPVRWITMSVVIGAAGFLAFIAIHSAFAPTPHTTRISADGGTNAALTAGGNTDLNWNRTVQLFNACVNRPGNLITSYLDNPINFDLDHGELMANGETPLSDADTLNGTTYKINFVYQVPIQPGGEADWSEGKFLFNARLTNGILEIDQVGFGLASDGWFCQSWNGKSLGDSYSAYQAQNRQNSLDLQKQEDLGSKPNKVFDIFCI